jgi:ankyrin repeat protein
MLSYDSHGLPDLVRERSNPLNAGDLCRFASTRDLETIKALQKSVNVDTLKADLYCRDNQQRTPLSIALSQGDTQIVSMILSLGN